MRSTRRSSPSPEEQIVLHMARRNPRMTLPGDEGSQGGEVCDPFVREGIPGPAGDYLELRSTSRIEATGVRIRRGGSPPSCRDASAPRRGTVGPAHDPHGMRRTAGQRCRRPSRRRTDPRSIPGTPLARLHAQDRGDPPCGQTGDRKPSCRVARHPRSDRMGPASALRGLTKWRSAASPTAKGSAATSTKRSSRARSKRRGSTPMPKRRTRCSRDVASRDRVASSEARPDARGIGRQLGSWARKARRTSRTRAKADDSTAASGSARSASRRNTGTMT